MASDAQELEDIYNDINKKIDIETDNDNDGIADYYEENMVMFNGVTIKLNKNNPDSDGDGLLDGEEVAELTYQYNSDKTQVIVTGKILSNPLEVDSDGDGLTDEEEIYYCGTSPMDWDTDDDGLSDCLEIENWYDPFEADADGDGRLDYQEYIEGTSPYVYDKDWYEYLWDFVYGFIAGDFIEDTDSVATLMGQVVSSCVPLIDIRDVLGNLLHGDYAFAGLSAIGLLPYAGDGAKACGKVVKFVIKNVDNLPMLMNLFKPLLKNSPELVANLGKSDEFAVMVESLAKADTSKLTKNEMELYKQFLQTAGVLEDVIKSGKTTNVELYSFGNASRPRGARPKDFGVNGTDDIVGPEMPPLPNGASNAADVNLAPLSGHYYKLPAGTVLPEGLGVVADGSDVIPNSGRFPGHHTIYPTRKMTVNEFNELYLSLPWVHGGKKP